MTLALDDLVVTHPAILYFGTPVVLVSTVNPDGTANLAPFSSAFWLGDRAVLGVARTSQTWTNLARTRTGVIALPSVEQVDAVDQLALATGRRDVTPAKAARGYVHAADKFGRAGLTPRPADLVAAPLVAECPVSMECAVERMSTDPDSAPVSELRVLRTHAHPRILMDGRPNRIDPDRWRPLVMSFQQFYGLGDRVAPSRLATIDEELYR